jgi:hypothetical protein
MFAEKTLQLYHLLSVKGVSQNINLNSLSEKENLKYLDKPLSQSSSELQEKIHEYKTKLYNSDKISYSYLLALIENLENLENTILRKSLLLNSYQKLSPDLTLARMELAQKRSNV